MNRNDEFALDELGISNNTSVWATIFSALSDLRDSSNKEMPANDDETDFNSQIINLRKLQAYLGTESSLKLELRTGLPRYRLVYLASQLKTVADANRDGKISRNEWESWVNKNGKEFIGKSKVAGGFVRVLAYSPTYSCSPPTIFLGTITFLQILFYLLSLYAPESLNIHESYDSNKWLICSYLVYDPRRRREAWRFITYMFLHGNHQHISFNTIMQLLVGIPLEMSQPGWLGSLRVAGLYFAGVIFGSLAASIVQPRHFLVGASAGVYALIAAHLATLILNWNEDGIVYQNRLLKSRNAGGANPPQVLNPLIRGLRLAFILLFTAIDIGQALYLTYYAGQSNTTSYAGHGFGALAGLLIGVFVLSNRKVEDWEVIFKWIAFTIFGVLLCIFVAWHIIGSQTGWFLPESWETEASCI